MSNYLKLEGLVGESKDSQHIGEIKIESVIWGYKKSPFKDDSRPKNRNGKVIGDLSVRKKCDGDSNKLAGAMVNGKTFPGGRLTLDGKDFDGKTQIYSVAMSNISISSIISDNSTESIGLNYDNPT